MHVTFLRFAILVFATFPLFYYLISLYSAWRFFSNRVQPPSDFTPPISNLKPIRGLDPDAYENFASLCRQDYPEFELLFCVGSLEDPAVPVVRKLEKDFPDCRIRLIVGSERVGTNDKVAKLARLTAEAEYEYLVINDSDVRVKPDYFRTMVAPMKNPKIGGVTCLYVCSGEQKSFAEELHWMGMLSDFFPSILTARQLDGVKFALGTSIATTRTALSKFGGYDAIIDRPADDLLIGRLIAEHANEMELLPYTVGTVADFASLQQLMKKRLRWIVVMRHLRPAGHLGLVFTQGLAWSCLALVAHPTVAVASIYFGLYAALRVAMTWLVGKRGLRQVGVWRRMPLFLVWDTVALMLWLISFTRDTIHWRDGEYRIRAGQLVPVATAD